jgi:predicted lipoprotein with Yx(FWY)xxD motif
VIPNVLPRKILAALGLAGAVLAAAACASSSSSATSTATAAAGATTSAPAASSAPPTSRAPAATATSLLARTIGANRVLTNAAGLTLYWFVPDTSTTSKCSGSCATYWPPVKGPATAGSGVTGTLGFITRSDGSEQATYDGHPLYTYAGDTAPGQAKGNGLNASGGIWHEVVEGVSPPASKPSSSSSSSSSSNGYGY